jgi:serine/threonine-protein kinase RsbT
MENKISISIDNEFDIVIARQKGREMAKEFGFATIDLALIATAISELTRNIITYAKKGTLSLELIQEEGKKGIRVIANDHGPGIESTELAMQDGYSTTKSLGLGLPGVKRLMDNFKLQSEFGKGTTVTVTKWVNWYG